MFQFEYNKLNPKYKNHPEKETLSDIKRLSSLPIKIVSSDRLCRVGRIELDKSYYLKTYCRGNGFLRDLFRQSKFDKEINNQNYFASIGIPTPEIVSINRDATFFGIKSAYFVTEDVAPAVSLLEHAESGQLSRLNKNQRRDLLEKLATYTQKLHSDGFAHLDLKWRNILVDIENNNKIYLIDCPAGYKPPKLTHAYLANKDLACLDRDSRSFLSKTDRLFFYKTYSGIEKIDSDTKQSISKVINFFKGGHRKVRRTKKLKRYLRDKFR